MFFRDVRYLLGPGLQVLRVTHLLLKIAFSIARPYRFVQIERILIIFNFSRLGYYYLKLAIRDVDSSEGSEPRGAVLTSGAVPQEGIRIVYLTS